MATCSYRVAIAHLRAWPRASGTPDGYRREMSSINLLIAHKEEISHLVRRQTASHEIARDQVTEPLVRCYPNKYLALHETSRCPSLRAVPPAK